MTRKYVCGPLYREAVSISELVPAMVRPGLVFDGLMRARWFCEASGISANATFELNGPTTPMTDESLASPVMLVTPCAGLCPFFRTLESSLETYFSVQPPRVLFAFAWVTAS